MRLAKPLVILLRVLGLILVVMGLGFWTGRWAGLVPMHRTLGVVFVLTFWAIAVSALASDRSRRGLALFAILWGVAVVMLGMTQQRILVGEYHWIVQTLHLGIGMFAMHIGALLTRAKTTSGETAALALD